MKITKVVLECKKCQYRSHNGQAPMIIESKKWLKSKIKNKMIICPMCENNKRFDIVWEGE